MPSLQRSVVLLGVLVSTSITYVACGGSDRTFGSGGPDDTGGTVSTTGGRSNGGSGNTGGRGNGGTGQTGGGTANGGGGGATGASGSGGAVGGVGGNGGVQDSGPRDAAEDSPSSNAD
jgi:hypothetical protein